jgi:hypothetical protein
MGDQTKARARPRRSPQAWGGRFTLDRALTLALLKSANGDPAARAKAKAMLDAQERAAMERDRQAALPRIAEVSRVAFIDQLRAPPRDHLSTEAF